MKPMCQVPPPSFGNSRNGTPKGPYAINVAGSDAIFCVSGQTRHLNRSVGGNDWNDLQNRIVHAQAHPNCYGDSRMKSINCTSSSATPRHLFCTLIMVCPRKLQSYLDEYSICFSQRDSGRALVEYLTMSIAFSSDHKNMEDARGRYPFGLMSPSTIFYYLNGAFSPF